MRLLVTRTYLFRRFLSVLYCQLEWVEGGSGVGKGERAVCRLAIQGRVSQNLRLIQVIFGHTASEAKGVCVCVCQCACEMRVRVSVCVQTRSRPKVTENSTAKQDAAVFLYSRNRPKRSSTFQSKSVGGILLFEKEKRSKESPGGRDFLLSQRSVEGTLEGRRPPGV